MTFLTKRLLFIGLSGIVFPFLGMAGNPGNDGNAKEKNQEAVRRVEAGSMKLTSELIDIKPQLKDQLNELIFEEDDELEDEFDALDDLYGEWNTERVNPYANITIPDTFSIDVSSYCAPTEGYITSKYGPRRRRFHYGIDLKVQVGDTIRAAFDGKIRVKEYERRGYGYYLVLRHNNGLETVYGHLSKFLVEPEEVVKAGQPIALGGNTGRSTGSHLHFEARFLGKPINPAEIFDFENYVPHKDVYVFNKKKEVEKSNKYTSRSIAYHRVKSGDTLGKISRRYGVSINTLCKLNNIKPTTTLRVGRSLRYS